MSENSYSLIQVTHKRKPEGRYLGLSIGDTLVNGRTVNLAVMVEIDNAWHPAREAGAELQQTFIRAFSRSSHQSVLTKFEDALKNCNSLIESAIQRLNSTISCAVAVVADGELYFSTLGEAKALLYRDGRLMSVGAKAQDKEERNFASVTSGELFVEDWFFLANKSFHELLQQLDSEQLEQGPMALTELLRQQLAIGDGPDVCGAAIKVGADEPLQTVIYVDELESRVPLSLPKFSLPAAGAKNLVAGIGTAAVGLFGKARGAVSNFRASRSAAPESYEITESESFEQEIEQRPLRRRPAFKFALPNLKFLRTLPRRWLIIGAIALLLIVVIVRVNANRSASNAAPPPNPLVSALSASNTATDITAITSQLTIANVQALSDGERTQLTELMKAASYSIIDSKSVFSELPAVAVSVSASADGIAVLDDTGQTWIYVNQLLKQVTHTPLFTTPQQIIWTSEKKLLVRSNNTIQLLSPETGAVSSVELPSALASAPLLIQVFENNVYLLNQTDRSLYKMSAFTDSLKDAAIYTKAGTLKSETVTDLVIPSDVVAVAGNGTLEVFLRNTLKKTISESRTAGTFQITTSSSQLFSAGKNEIKLYTLADFQPVNQKYWLLDDTGITDLTFDNGALIIAAGKKLYRVAF